MNLAPTNRLLVILGLVLLPSGLVAAAAPSWTPVCVAAAVVCVGGVVMDAVVSRGRLRGVGLRLPETLRLVKGRAATFDVEVLRSGAIPEELRLGLVFPPPIIAEEETRTKLAGSAERFRTSWTALGSSRGSHRISEAMVETRSAAGLWDIREPRPVASEFRVYPNLLADKKTAAPLLLSRTTGSHPLRQVGKGREFEKLREYIPGDTFNDIHWRATARHGKPVTKVFQVERTQEVYAVLDCSRLSGRVVRGEPALEHYLTAALLLGLAVQKEGDLFGVIAFDDQVRTIVRAGGGRAHFGSCREAVYAAKSKRVSPDYRELSQFIRTRLRKRALLMMLTDLDDAAIAEEFESNLGVVRRTHLVATHMILPGGVQPMFAGSLVSTADEVYDRLAGHLRWQSLEQTRRRLATKGIALTLLRPENAAADLVARYRQIKGRQLL
ncbi:MAG TPA: DUF58 domain-containing protein [Bryobacteraceae bacterium]|nr:DUF58 domain-containing protein [Bryobacteraceae bacterium]